MNFNVITSNFMVMSVEHTFTAARRGGWVCVYSGCKYLRTCQLHSDDCFSLRRVCFVSFAIVCELWSAWRSKERTQHLKMKVSRATEYLTGNQFMREKRMKVEKHTNRQRDREREGLGATAADSLHLLVNILLQLKLWLVRLLHLPVLQLPERRRGRHQFPLWAPGGIH